MEKILKYPVILLFFAGSFSSYKNDIDISNNNINVSTTNFNNIKMKFKTQ
jgi:hypothetical protein